MLFDDDFGIDSDKILLTKEMWESLGWRYCDITEPVYYKEYRIFDENGTLFEAELQFEQMHALPYNSITISEIDESQPFFFLRQIAYGMGNLLNRNKNYFVQKVTDIDGVIKKIEEDFGYIFDFT